MVCHSPHVHVPSITLVLTFACSHSFQQEPVKLGECVRIVGMHMHADEAHSHKYSHVDEHNINAGEPLYFKPAQPGHPTQEEIDDGHAQYVCALRRLFDQHKSELGYGDRELLVS